MHLISLIILIYHVGEFRNNTLSRISVYLLFHMNILDIK